jgi:hypothetical protein
MGRIPETEVMERGILMARDSVLAILRGWKTQTRRLMNPQPWKGLEDFFYWKPRGETVSLGESWWADRCPHGAPGDRLWVRETWRPSYHLVGRFPSPVCSILYRADDSKRKVPYEDFARAKWVAGETRWRPSIFMPRVFSRIDLEITEVRVERLQDMDGYDAQEEGILANCDADLCDGVTLGEFAKLWDSLHEKKGRGWEANPWVWVIIFKRLSEN